MHDRLIGVALTQAQPARSAFLSDWNSKVIVNHDVKWQTMPVSDSRRKAPNPAMNDREYCFGLKLIEPLLDRPEWQGHSEAKQLCVEVAEARVQGALWTERERSAAYVW
jgi:hypothetical protein